MVTTRKECVDFLRNVFAIENLARRHYMDDEEFFNDGKLTVAIRLIRRDEEAHIEILQGLISLLEHRK
jgi:hypothetical protein